VSWAAYACHPGMVQHPCHTGAFARLGFYMYSVTTIYAVYLHRVVVCWVSDVCMSVFWSPCNISLVPSDSIWYMSDCNMYACNANCHVTQAMSAWLLPVHEFANFAHATAAKVAVPVACVNLHHSCNCQDNGSCHTHTHAKQPAPNNHGCMAKCNHAGSVECAA